MSVDSLALSRAQLPLIVGSNLPQQLQTGRNECAWILKHYVADFTYSEERANAILDEVNVWIERNQKELESALADPTREQLGNALCLAFDAQMARDYIIANFTIAAAGLGPWMSGRVGEEADRGVVITREWAQQDAANRLKVFASIMRMEQDGFLKHLFQPGEGDPPCPGATGAFGMGPLIVGIIVAGAVIATVACCWIIMKGVNKSNQAADELLAELCRLSVGSEKAHCVNALIDLKKQNTPGDVAKTAVYVLGGLGAVYLLLKLAEREGWSKSPEGGAFGAITRRTV